MRQGTIISGSAHFILIALALWGMPDFRDKEQPRPQSVSTVSLVSASDFEASQSAAPSTPDVPELALSSPQEDNSAVAPDAEVQAPQKTTANQPQAPAAEELPNLDTLSAQDPVTALPDISLDAPAQAQDEAPLGFDMPLPNAAPQDGSVNSNNTALLAPERPNLAPRIDTSAAPKPPEPVREAPVPEPVPEVEPEPEPTLEPEPEPVETPSAPPEATTEIVPDAEIQEEPTTPKAAARPKGRPKTPVENEEEKRKAQEAAIAAALAAANAGATSPEPQDGVPITSGATLGRDFNSSQKQAIGDKIGSVWNKTLLEGKDGFEKLVVTVRVRMTADGRIIGKVEPVNPELPTGDFKVAYEAARRAIIRALPIPLPQDKFRDGDFLEIRFDPGRAAISLQ